MKSLSFDWIYALIGFLIMFGLLGGIGINKPRGMSVKMWCVGYLVVAVGFRCACSFRVGWATMRLLTICLLGLSAGAATGLAIHVMHHINEEDAHPTIMG